jgi:hypothetical protein
LAKEKIIEQLQKEFGQGKAISRADLFDFFLKTEPDLKNSTFRWRIYQLKEWRVITPISKNIFSFNYKPDFRPEIGVNEKRITSKIESQFPDIKYCIWSTKAVIEFMLHIPGKYLTIIQVEKDALEPVFEFLNVQNIGRVFIQPEEKELDRYVFDVDRPIVLQTLVSRAPVQRVDKVSTITIEKLIVDLFCDKNLFIAFQGGELVHIFNNAFQRYSINFTKLLHYAGRRRKGREIRQFLQEKTDIPKVILND